MKVIRLRHPAGLDNLYVDNAEPRDPASNEIQVRIHATTLNYHDYMVVLGHIPCVEGRVPMSDGAGVVTAIGGSVSEFAVGDHVVSTFFPDWVGGESKPAKLNRMHGDSIDGFAQEYVTAECNAFTQAPKGYDHVEAATLTCAGLTAWRSIAVTGNLLPGSTVLTQGTGGVSIFALQFAKAHGCRVIATSSSNEKLERLRQLGADETINYRETENWGERAFELAGEGVDHVVDIAGGDTINESLKAIRMGGHISSIGFLGGLQSAINTTDLVMKQAQLVGITVGSIEQQQDMVKALEANNIKPVIDRKFPLEDIAEAFRYQASGQHFGKICLEF